MNCECKNDILTIEFLKVNGFNVKLKSLMEMLYKCQGIWKCFLLHQYIYIYIYINYICMHVLRHYGSLKMCKECINV